MTPSKTTDQLEPTVFVIFGGAGDLTWRKLIPALFDLSQDRSLPVKFAIIAVDRIKLGDHPLRRLDNVVLTPHLGYVTEENLTLHYRETVENIAAFLSGAPIRRL